MRRSGGCFFSPREVQAATSAEQTLTSSVVSVNLSFGFVVLFTSITQTYCTAELWIVINSPIMAFIYLTCRLMWASTNVSYYCFVNTPWLF